MDGILALDGSDPTYAKVERENDYSEEHVCSDSNSEGVLEHLAKNKLVVSNSNIQLEKKWNGKGIKVRGSSRVVSKPSRLSL